MEARARGELVAPRERISCTEAEREKERSAREWNRPVSLPGPLDLSGRARAREPDDYPAEFLHRNGARH